MKSLGAIFGSLATVPLTETARARSPSRALSSLPGAIGQLHQMQGEEGRGDEEMGQPRRRPDQTNDGGYGDENTDQRAARG